MGFGSSPLGVALFGADVLPSAGSAPRSHVPPRALRLDGSTRDYALDTTTGLYIDGDPIDQRVALALLVVRGSIVSAVNVGSTLRSIRNLGTPDTARLVEDAVRRALADLTLAGDVVVTSVVQESTRAGQLRVAVSYTKPRDAAPATTTATISIG